MNTPASTSVKRQGVPGAWVSLIIALLMAAIPIPVLLLWIIPALLALVFAIMALSSGAPIHGSLVLVGVLVVLPLAWLLGMVMMIGGAGLLISGDFSSLQALLEQQLR